MDGRAIQRTGVDKGAQMTDLRDEPDDVLEMDWGDYPDEDEPVDRVQTTNPD